MPRSHLCPFEPSAGEGKPDLPRLEQRDGTQPLHRTPASHLQRRGYDVFMIPGGLRRHLLPEVEDHRRLSLRGAGSLGAFGRHGEVRLDGEKDRDLQAEDHDGVPGCNCRKGCGRVPFCDCPRVPPG